MSAGGLNRMMRAWNWYFGTLAAVMVALWVWYLVQ